MNKFPKNIDNTKIINPPDLELSSMMIKSSFPNHWGRPSSCYYTRATPQSIKWITLLAYSGGRSWQRTSNPNAMNASHARCPVRALNHNYQWPKSTTHHRQKNRTKKSNWISLDQKDLNTGVFTYKYQSTGIADGRLNVYVKPQLVKQQKSFSNNTFY